MSMVSDLKMESARQEGWANEGEATVVGGGPDLMLKAAVEIDRLEWIEGLARKVVEVHAVTGIPRNETQYSVQMRRQQALMRLSAALQEPTP